jgi:hypothetical protein
VFDNGSEKRVFEHVKDLLNDKVLWIGADINRSFLWNFQRAMNACDTQYLMMLHDDDRLCENFLESQVQLLKDNEKISAVSCNGYLIDEKGRRIGKTITPTKGTESVESFTSSGQVALKYASNSCIPFSPTIYRSDIARKVSLRDEFEKVVDAVFFCDLADNQAIAYQTRPLYECRLHAGQDSTHFSLDLMNDLGKFYSSRVCSTQSERDLLDILLQNQSAIRWLKRIALSLKNRKFKKTVELVGDPCFRISYAMRAVWARLSQRLMRKM